MQANGQMGTTTLLMLGASATPVCGVRDHARTLGTALQARGVRVVTRWWETGIADRPTAIRSWLASLETAAAEEKPHWILWEYSVFTYGRRGIPVLAPLVARRLRQLRTPLVGCLHEYGVPFGRRGLRGMAQAATQRVALAYIYRTLDAAVVTTEDRQEWLGGRHWLPRKPSLFLPVCSNVGFDDVKPGHATINELAIGVIGFGSDTYLVDPVVEAVARLRERQPRARLVLVGAPGPEHPLAQRWRTSARRYGISEALGFTGFLAVDEYSRAVSALDIVVFPDPDGPASRKGTLAAALAAGKPTLAIEGPHAWHRFVDEGVVTLVPPDAGSIEEQLAGLSRNRNVLTERARLARSFYNRWQSPDVIASKLMDFLESILPTERH